MAIEQYQRVRIRKLLSSPEHYDGWGFNTRAPKIGDIGYVVDVLSAPHLPDNYVVEASSPDGITVWLGNFAFEEIEAIAEHQPISDQLEGHTNE